MSRCITFLKNWTLPVAIATGATLYLLFAMVPPLQAAGAVLGPLCEALLPVSLFLTLFVTFAKVDFHLMRLRRWHAAIIAAQLVGVAALTAATYHVMHADGAAGAAALRTVVLTLEAVLVCVIAPCASASPVVTAKLGGDLTQMTTFALLSALAASLLIPAVFPLLEPHAGATFAGAFLAILRRLAMVLLLPLLLGAVVRHWVRPLYSWLMRTQDVGFYLWSVSLAITSGITVRNIVGSDATHALVAAIAAASLATALVQFRIGRAIGQRLGAPICCGQGMFQKNTGLAIWIAYVYLSPTASIGAGCYVLWQNIINCYELWQRRTAS